MFSEGDGHTDRVKEEVVGGELVIGNVETDVTLDGIETVGIKTEVITGVTRELVTIDEREVV